MNGWNLHFSKQTWLILKRNRLVDLILEYGIWFINTIRKNLTKIGLTKIFPQYTPENSRLKPNDHPIERKNHLNQSLKFGNYFKTLSLFSLVSTSNSSKNKTHPQTMTKVKRTPQKKRFGGDLQRQVTFSSPAAVDASLLSSLLPSFSAEYSERTSVLSTKWAPTNCEWN